MSKYILSIWWGYCSGAALARIDESLSIEFLGASSEERFVKKKNTSEFPINTINWLLKESNITRKDISNVIYTSQDVGLDYILFNKGIWEIQDYILENKEYWAPKLLKNIHENNYFTVMHQRLDTQQWPGQRKWEDIIDFNNLSISNRKFSLKIPSLLEEYFDIAKDKIEAFDHHSSHRWYAYFYENPELEERLVFTIDGWGDGRNATVTKVFVKDGILVEEELFSSSKCYLARVYRYMTLLLGMKPSEHEFKVMGLAGYAKIKYSNRCREIFTQYLSFKNGDFEISKDVTDSYYWFKDKFEGERFDNIAGGLQIWLEDVLIEMVRYFVEKSKVNTVAFSGGVAMNVKAMGEIAKLSEVSKLYVPPSSGDESHIFGSALSYYVKINKNRSIKNKKNLLSSFYTGFRSSEDDEIKLIGNITKNSKFSIIKNPTAIEVASKLIELKSIAVCRGSAEFGARALGNRSILIDARSMMLKDQLNLSIKNRDFWMPFAPIVIDKYVGRYLHNPKNIISKHMTLSFETTVAGFNDLMNATHIADKTCRVQMLFREDNNFIYDVIDCFSRKTNVGGLLNTSYNQHGFPIVNTIEDAFEVFINTSLNCLLLNNYLITKNNLTLES